MNITLTRSADLSEGKVRVCFGCGNIHDRASWISLQTDGLDNGILCLHKLPWTVRHEFRSLTDNEIREIFGEFRIPEGVKIEPYSDDDDTQTETWFYITPATREAIKEFSNAFGRWFVEGYRKCYQANLARGLESWLYKHAQYNAEKGEWEEM